VRRLLGRVFWVDDLCRLVAALLEERYGRLTPRFPPGGAEAPAVLAGCDRFAAALADFGERAGLHNILAAGADITTEVLDAIGGGGAIVSWLHRTRTLLGPGPEVIRIFPSPLCNPHVGFGPTVTTRLGTESWVVFGPVWRPTDRPWRLVGFHSPKLGRVIRHELGHAHLNHHTASAAEVGHLAYFFPPLRAAMKRLGYGRWDICLNEHILRALEVLLLAERAGPATAQRAIRREQRRGFTLIRPAVEAFHDIAGTPLSDALPAYLRAVERHARRYIS
jgi:hypothetical protein